MKSMVSEFRKFFIPIYTSLYLNETSSYSNKNIVFKKSDYNIDNIQMLIDNENNLIIDPRGLNQTLEGFDSDCQNTGFDPKTILNKKIKLDIYVINDFTEYNSFVVNNLENYNLVFVPDDLYNTIYAINIDKRIVDEIEASLANGTLTIENPKSLFYSFTRDSKFAYLTLNLVSNKFTTSVNYGEENSILGEITLNHIYLSIIKQEDRLKDQKNLFNNGNFNYVTNFPIEKDNMDYLSNNGILKLYPDIFIALSSTLSADYEIHKKTTQELYEFMKTWLLNIKINYVEVTDLLSFEQSLINSKKNNLESLSLPSISIIYLNNTKLYNSIMNKRSDSYLLLNKNILNYNMHDYLTSVISSNIFVEEKNTNSHSLKGFTSETLENHIIKIFTDDNPDYNLILPYSNDEEYNKLSEIISGLDFKNFKINKEKMAEANNIAKKELFFQNDFELNIDQLIKFNIVLLNNEKDFSPLLFQQLSVNKPMVNIILTNLNNIENKISKSTIIDYELKDLSTIVKMYCKDKKNNINIIDKIEREKRLNKIDEFNLYNYSLIVEKFKKNKNYKVRINGQEVSDDTINEEVLNSSNIFEKLLGKMTKINDSNVGNLNINNLMDTEAPAEYKVLTFLKPDVNFEDIIGLKQAKTNLKELSEIYSEKIEELQKYKIEREKGVILYGEPGVGKTMIAKAFANTFDNAILAYMSTEQVMSDKKNTDKGLTGLKAEITKVSNENPDSTIIIFLDEIDSLRARGKSAHNNSFYDGMTNEMLFIIDNLPNNVMIIGATNYVENLDPALVRKGRLGIKIEIKNDFSKLEVETFMKKCFTDAKMSNSFKYLKPISNMIYYMNGSEISAILNKIKQKLYFKKKQGTKTKIYDLAVEAVYSEKYNLADFKLTDEEIMSTSYHEAGHALMYMKFYGTQKLHEVSVYPTAKALGFVSYKFDKQEVTKYDLENLILIALAGRYAEKLITNNISVGASSDLIKTNELIDSLLTKYGMGDIENLSVKKTNGSSEYLLSKLDVEHENILKKLSAKCEAIILENKSAIEEMANDLFKKKVLIDDFDKYSKLISSK